MENKTDNNSITIIILFAALVFILTMMWVDINLSLEHIRKLILIK